MSSSLLIFDQILPNLYIGNIVAATSQDIGSMHLIINASKSMYTLRKDTIYHDIDIRDSVSDNIKQHFETVTELIHQYNSENKKVLVHCMNAISRAPTLVIAYLMRYLNLSLAEALLFVRDARSHPTIPNTGFFLQLQDYEMELFGKQSITVPQFLKLCH